MSNTLFYMLLQYHANYIASVPNAWTVNSKQRTLNTPKLSSFFLSFTLIEIELNKHLFALPSATWKRRKKNVHHTFHNGNAKYQPRTNNKLNGILKMEISLRHKHIVTQLWPLLHLYRTKCSHLASSPVCDALHNIPIILFFTALLFFSQSHAHSVCIEVAT